VLRRARISAAVMILTDMSAALPKGNEKESEAESTKGLLQNECQPR
jgi:hypothetical protein